MGGRIEAREVEQVARPMPRAGAPIARRKAMSSPGFSASRRYASASLISLRS